MNGRRLIGVYAVLTAFFFVGICRIYVISQNKSYAKKAQSQTVTTLLLEKERGNFYDRSGLPLTGAERQYEALCIPGGGNYARLFDYADEAGQKKLYANRNAAAPFLVEVSQDLSAQQITTFAVPRRYAALQACAHLIGYLDGAGKGVSGLEAALDKSLAGDAESAYVQCVTNAQGALMQGMAPEYHAAQGSGTDVQLTIDAAVQTACEGIADGMMTTGCVLVLETQTAQVLASVSVPGYQPNNVSASLHAAGSPLLDRTLAAYAVGSVFKPVLAAAALEQGQSGLSIGCAGYLRVGDHIYRCAGGVPHGETDLQQALEKSCNCYFITLGRQLGGDTLYRYAQAFGFGQPTRLAGRLSAAAGSLPGPDTLQDLGQLANFSFGQGQLTATPLQTATMMNVIADGGVYHTPGFLLRLFRADTGRTVSDLRQTDARRVISEQNAAALRKMLAGVVTDGLGSQAQPTFGAAAGKTGTAQTGRFDAAGKEYKNLWFAGFYPAQNPAYTIVVLQDDQIQAAYSSAAIFAKVCDALAYLDGTGTNSPVRTGESS